jgi:pyruvate, orthophosphate dikinase
MLARSRMRGWPRPASARSDARSAPTSTRCRARSSAAGGGPVILVRPDTSTEDVAGFAVSAGIVTAVGGRTAHAALVARQMGKPCVVGCAALTIDGAGRTALLAGSTINEGDWLTIDGGAGAVYLGQCRIVVDQPEAELAEVARWRRDAMAPA